MKEQQSGCEHGDIPPPAELSSSDPDVLRGAIRREHDAYRRAQCLASMQAEVVQLALDLLIREPDIEGFFAGLTKNMVEESESHACGVWLIDESGDRCSLWMAYIAGRLYTSANDGLRSLPFPHERFGAHLFANKPGWQETMEYVADDPRLPAEIRAFQVKHQVAGHVVTPLVIGNRTLGWFKLSTCDGPDCEGSRWWRRMLTEAIARQAALALHFTRLVEQRRLEERRKAILEERNRLARDIHDNLAQGFGAILMQLQAAQREMGVVSPAVQGKLETAIDLARTHLVEARRSVGALRPNVGNGEAISTSLKRIADLVQRTTPVPIDIDLDELPRVGDAIEREIVGIAQEALTNAVRHARARRITVRASAVRSIGVRLSVADDGRGFARDRSFGGFGMTSMHERAERIGASLTIVTAPRGGTEVVLAWEPELLPTQVHVAS
ncbi:MAG TPA: GAF domain-containing sensor histidine kinase [Vicinamibacterales bacterium]